MFLFDRRAVVYAVAVSLSLNPNLDGGAPAYDLGLAASTGLSQPTADVQLVDLEGNVMGPTTATNFIMDTGANGILMANTVLPELTGYKTEGSVQEQGIGGFLDFDVSSPYEFRYETDGGGVQSLKSVRVMSSEDTNFCQLGICQFHGIAGMPSMNERVVSLDFSEGTAHTTIGDELPSIAGRQLEIPLTTVQFEPHADGPLPTWAHIPFLTVDPVHGDVRQTGNFVFDTGAQVSLISSELAFSLGLDANGNGDLSDEAVGSLPVSGVGGTVNLDQLVVDQFRVPTSSGIDLLYHDVTVAIADIHPAIDGIFGMNLLTAGSLSFEGLDLGGLGGLLGGGNPDDLEALVDLLSLLGLGLDDIGLGGLGGLGGLLGNGGGGYFDSAYLDFRGMSSSGEARMIVELSSDIGAIDVGLHRHGDLNADGIVDLDDRVIWVEQQNTYFGDANLDGLFDSRDLVAIFQAGEYDDQSYKNSHWGTGDWNGDAEFNSKDIVLAFTEGGYESGPRVAQSVPEPDGLMSLIVAASCFRAKRRKRRVRVRRTGI